MIILDVTSKWLKSANQSLSKMISNIFSVSAKGQRHRDRINKAEAAKWNKTMEKYNKRIEREKEQQKRAERKSQEFNEKAWRKTKKREAKKLIEQQELSEKRQRQIERRQEVLERAFKRRQAAREKQRQNENAIQDINKLKNELVYIANEGGEYAHEFRESYFVIEDIIDRAVKKHHGNEQSIFDILANWSVNWYDELVRLIQAFASDSEYNTATGKGNPDEGRQKYLEQCRSLAKALGVQFVEARVSFL